MSRECNEPGPTSMKTCTTNYIYTILCVRNMQSMGAQSLPLHQGPLHSRYATGNILISILYGYDSFRGHHSCQMLLSLWRHRNSLWQTLRSDLRYMSQHGSKRLLLCRFPFVTCLWLIFMILWMPRYTRVCYFLFLHSVVNHPSWS
jgi:hypothetical protein